MVLLIIFLLGILFIYFTYHIIKVWKLVYVTSHPKKSKAMNLNSIPYLYEIFHFTASNHMMLEGIVYYPNGQAKGTILAFHYLGGSKEAIYYYIEPLLKDGFAVVSFDYPNHGNSQTNRKNKYTLEGDLKFFIEKIKRLGLPKPFGTIGFSVGATLAISSIDYMPQIKAVVVDSGPLILVKNYFEYVLNNKEIKNNIQRNGFIYIYLYFMGFSKMSRRMVQRLQNLKGNHFLMFHCKKDGIISYGNALFMKNLLGSRADLITVNSGHHLTNKVVLEQQYDEKVLHFFNDFLIEKRGI